MIIEGEGDGSNERGPLIEIPPCPLI